jgi:multidrug efflux system outer membrane protein
MLAAQAEVEDALTELARERERGAALADALAAQKRAVQLANDLFTRGLVDLFEVIDAQREQFDIETDAARSATRASTAAVALHKALGGGWSAGEAVAPPIDEADSTHAAMSAESNAGHPGAPSDD